MSPVGVRRPSGNVILVTIVLVLSAAGLVATPSAAATTAPTVSPAAPMAGESARVAGKVPTKVKRPVRLQRKDGSTWVTQASGKTNKKGRYVLTTTFAASTTVRVVAKKVRVNGKRYAAFTSKTRAVTIAAQSVTLAMAATAQVGAPVAASATSKPVRAGRPVALQVLSGDTWSTVSSDTQDAAGKTTYPAIVPAQTGEFSYRALALAWKGAPARASATTTLVVSEPPVAGDLELVSKALDGGPANGASGVPRVSGDGRYVVFASHASNLVAGDTEGKSDVFLRDLQTGTTVRVSQTPSGVGGDQTSWNPDISNDGRYVAYRSSASNLGWNGGNRNDVLLWDRTTGETTPVTPPLSPEELTTLDGAADGPRISGDGSTVAFVTDDPSLADDDGATLDDAFVWDRASGVVTWISHGAETSPGEYAGSNRNVSEVGALSDDGNRVPFTTSAVLVSGVNTGPACCTTQPDVYIWEGFGDAQVVTLATINDENELHTDSDEPALSGDGTTLAFVSGEGFAEAPSDSTPDVFTWSSAGGYDQVSAPLFTTSRQSSGNPAISEGGGTVVFHSRDDYLVNEPGNNTWDIFRRVGGVLELLTHDAAGGPANNSSTAPDVSSDGSVVVFQSVATDLVPGDTNATTDIFVFVD
jgi:Tol biopolymer transport system component